MPNQNKPPFDDWIALKVAEIDSTKWVVSSEVSSNCCWQMKASIAFKVAFEDTAGVNTRRRWATLDNDYK